MRAKETDSTVASVPRGKKHRKYRGCGLMRCQKHRYLHNIFAPRVFEKKRENSTRLTIFWRVTKASNASAVLQKPTT
jgi:hypothetical protein